MPSPLSEQRALTQVSSLPPWLQLVKVLAYSYHLPVQSNTWNSGMPLRSGQAPGLCAVMNPRERRFRIKLCFIVWMITNFKIEMTAFYYTKDKEILCKDFKFVQIKVIRCRIFVQNEDYGREQYIATRLQELFWKSAFCLELKLFLIFGFFNEEIGLEF